MRPPALFWLSLAALLTACAGADVAGRCLQLPVSNKVSRRALKRCRVA